MPKLRSVNQSYDASIGRTTQSQWHDQVAVPELPGARVDVGIAGLISWCARQGLRTVNSCQGGGRKRAFVAFADLADLDRFYVLLASALPHSVEVQTMTMLIRPQHPWEQWTFDADPRRIGSDAHRVARPSLPRPTPGDPGRLCGCVRLPSEHGLSLSVQLSELGPGSSSAVDHEPGLQGVMKRGVR